MYQGLIVHWYSEICVLGFPKESMSSCLTTTLNASCSVSALSVSSPFEFSFFDVPFYSNQNHDLSFYEMQGKE